MKRNTKFYEEKRRKEFIKRQKLRYGGEYNRQVPSLPPRSPKRINYMKFSKAITNPYEKEFGAIKDYDWTYPKYGRNKKSKKLNRVKDRNYMSKEDYDWKKNESYFYREEKWNRLENEWLYYHWEEYKPKTG